MSAMKPSFISGIIILGVAGAMSFQIYTEQQKKVLHIQQEVSQIVELEEQRSQAAELLKLLEAHRQRLAPSPETSWLVRQISKLSSGAGIDLASVDPQEPHRVGEFDQPAVTVRFLASYHELGHLISQIESTEHYLHVDKAALDADPGAEDSSRASVLLKISTLFLPPVL